MVDAGKGYNSPKTSNRCHISKNTWLAGRPMWRWRFFRWLRLRIRSLRFLFCRMMIQVLRRGSLHSGWQLTAWSWMCFRHTQFRRLVPSMSRSPLPLRRPYRRMLTTGHHPIRPRWINTSPGTVTCCWEMWWTSPYSRCR